MAVLDKRTQFSVFTIWEPRYYDLKVLLAAFRIKEHNKIVFTKVPQLGTGPYYISGKKAKSFKKESNGKIACYAIPIHELEPLELTAHSAYDL